RGASFITAMALADPGGSVVAESEGICRGLVLRAPCGHGPGYDPIFHVREAGTSYALLNEHQKSRFGSRGRAARAMAPQLRRLLGLDG
ncbi:MAG: non-canonical purine NTP pyrophosphatase, partial [Synechococcaceae cyanobacterium]|nr:non-canonical purine NTP pyrophosphatase [Synechococcaceae cyanobacterium]